MSKDSERPQGRDRSRGHEADDEVESGPDDLETDDAMDDGTMAKRGGARSAPPTARATPAPRHPKSIPLEPSSRGRATERTTPRDDIALPAEEKSSERLAVAPPTPRGTTPLPGKVEKDLYLPSPARASGRAPVAPAPPPAGRPPERTPAPTARPPERTQAPSMPAPPPTSRSTPRSPAREESEPTRKVPPETPAEQRPSAPSREEPFRTPAPPARPAASSEARRALLQTREAGHEIIVNEDRLVPGDIKLVIEQGLSINKEFLVSDPEMLMGRRDPDQDFIPDIDLFDQETATNRYISRRQARLFFKDGGLLVEDLDSSNGTAVNNRLIPPHEPRAVKPGDKILLGQSVMLRVRRMST